MTTKHKILEYIYYAIKDIESNWQPELEKLNIWDDVSFIYNSKLISGDNRLGNIVLAFVVLAYDNNSTFLEPHKDRRENKEKIIVHLYGLSALTIELFIDILNNEHFETYNLSVWYLKYQMDWRWKSSVTMMEYDSMASNMSNKGAVDATEANQIGKMLETAEKLRRRADELQNELRIEFLNLDTVLEKEKRQKITDVEKVDFMSFESWRKNNPPKAS